MNKICGYSCEHNKGGVCQITMCDKVPTFSTTTENYMQVIDGTGMYYEWYVKYLQQELQRKDNNWNKLKEYIKASDECWDLQAVFDKMNELEGRKEYE